MPSHRNKNRTGADRGSRFALLEFSERNPAVVILGIILIPLTVALATLWSDTRIDARQRHLAAELSQRQEQLAITQTIDAYFASVGEILMSAKRGALADRVVITRTQGLLQRLTEPADNALVVRFVADLRSDFFRRPARELERSTNPYVDLSDIDLSGSDLSFVALSRAKLAGARLVRTQLRWANLAGADLRGADLSGADLEGTEFRGADLTGAVLQKARLHGTSFVGATLIGADLTGADVASAVSDGVRVDISYDGARFGETRGPDGMLCPPAGCALAR